MSFNGCACEEGMGALGHGIMNEMAFAQFLPDDPDPGMDGGDISTFGEGDGYGAFTYGQTGLGGVVLSDVHRRRPRMSVGDGARTGRWPGGLGDFFMPEIGGGDPTGGGGFGPGISLGPSGGVTCPDGSIVLDQSQCSLVADGSGWPGSVGPAGTPTSAPAPTGGGTDWGSIIKSLSSLGGSIAQAVSGPQYPQGGYRITGYTPQGQPIYGGVSGGLGVGPGGLTASAGISTQTLMLLVGGILIFMVASKR